LARPTQLPPAAESVATNENVIAMPTKMGSPDRRKGWSDLAKINGKTGSTQGLKIVRTPPR
jgi:hypothetical protein